MIIVILLAASWLALSLVLAWSLGSDVIGPESKWRKPAVLIASTWRIGAGLLAGLLIMLKLRRPASPAPVDEQLEDIAETRSIVADLLNDADAADDAAVDALEAEIAEIRKDEAANVAEIREDATGRTPAESAAAFNERMSL